MHKEIQSTKREHLQRTRGRGGLWLRGTWLGLGMWALIGLVSPSPSQAVDFHCPSGDVTCLINAINVANVNGVPNTIQLEAGDYVATEVNNDTEGSNAFPSITGIMTIVGAESQETSLTQSGLGDTRILHVSVGADLTLKHLTVRGGWVPSFSEGGGGILNRGTLTLDHSSVRDNTQSEFSNVRGVGIWNAGKLTLEYSTVANNGHKEDNMASTTGAGIFNDGGDLIIHESTIIYNGSEGDEFPIAGGIAHWGSGSLELTHSVVANNSGGISNSGQARIEHTTIKDNASIEGGIANGGVMTISESAIVGNNGIVNGGLLTITNSTIEGNETFSTPFWFCGRSPIQNSGDLTITNSTIANNIHRFFGADENCGSPPPGGLNNVGDGRVHLQNTILAHNVFFPGGWFPPAEPSDCGGSITSLGHNLIGDTLGCDITLQASDLTGDPVLGAFTDDGTPGNGHLPLLATSQAIDAANDGACSPTDQLGTPRPVEPGTPHCDMGAIEFAELVNEVFALTQLTTAFNPTAGPDAPAGVFTITATFTHTGGPAISQPFFRVTELSGQNLLLNANGEPGGVGATLTPTVPDGGVQSGESFTTVFEIGLQELQGFTFFVDLYGVPEE